jgi:Flp pilus assembly protein TadD
LRLSKSSKAAADFVIYGIECGRNAMPERTEGAFNEALRLDPKSMSALNGLAMCSFEKMEVGRAEELFRKSQKAGPDNDCAKKMLAKIAALRKGEPWAKRAESRGKFWKHWQDTELTMLSDGQRQKRMAEVVARRR